MSNNDRTTCILKIEQSQLAIDKILTYLHDIQNIMDEDEKKFQRKHPELSDKIDMVIEIVVYCDDALKKLRAEF